MGKFSDLNNPNSEINEITQEPFKEEELQELSINAARYSRTSSTPSTEFVKPRCICCGLTQVKCHRTWKDIHDPNDPEKYCFRGPEYIVDKQIREKKHPPATQQISMKNEFKKKSPQDPDLNGIQESKTAKLQNIKDLTKS